MCDKRYLEKKAFDSISRAALWVKLQNADISGKILKVIHNLYDNVKSCVRNNQEYSAFFRCDIGVRQGEKALPKASLSFCN
jgi:hypothetical protein